MAGSPKTCNDDDVCTADSCDEATGACKNTADPDGCPATPCATTVCDPVDGCITLPDTYGIEPEGVIAPEEGGAPATMPDAYNYGNVAHFAQDDVVGVIFDTLAPIPAVPAPNISFADFSLILYGPGQGAPMWPHPPLQGATHMISVGYKAGIAGTWLGDVWHFPDGAAQWQVLQSNVPFMMAGNTVDIVAAIDGVNGCTPYKFLSQVVEDGQLKWKALTLGQDGQPSTNPDGQPFGSEVGAGL